MSSMESMVPDYLYPVAWLFVAVGVISAAVILYDVHNRGFRQDKKAMEAIWAITALYFGPVALLAYYKWGRTNSAKVRELTTSPIQGGWGRSFTDGTPGGAAATVAHFIGVPLVVTSGLTIAGTDLWVMIITIALLAIALLFLFEKFVAGLTTGRALLTAAIIVLAFDVGMGGWMIFLHFSSFMPPPTDIRFFLLMQIGNILGFITAYPVVRTLARRGPGAAHSGQARLPDVADPIPAGTT